MLPTPEKREDSEGLTMTSEVIGRVILGVWLRSCAAAAAQLPPDVLVDKYLL